MIQLTRCCLLLLLFCGCVKTDMPERNFPSAPLRLPYPLLPAAYFPKTIPICIYSLPQLQQFLGTGPLPVTEVELEDGTIIRTDDTLLGIMYYAAPGQDGNSLFHSQLTVTTNYWGTAQTYTADVWSLGCVLSGSPGGVLTNLRQGPMVFRINTCFEWAVPPFNTQAKRVRYLTLRSL